MVIIVCERLKPDELNPDEQSRVVAFEQTYGLKVLEVNRTDDGIKPTLINGSEVPRSDWLEVVRIGQRSCTGTVVGRNAVITAAHCDRNGGRNTLEIFNGSNISYRVIHHPRYRNGSGWDVAVLVLDTETDVRAATVGVDYTFSKGADVDILGYGCTRPGGGGGNDGILRFGESKIVGFTGTDAISSWRPGGAALCFGDSGGPMFADGSNSGSSRRKLIAVNSKGNIRDTNYNMRLDLPEVRDWLQSVADQYSLEILGVNAGGDEPDPDPQPDPPSDGGLMYAVMANQHRKTAQHYTDLAAWYDERAQGESTTPDDNDGGCIADDGTFGLPPVV